MNFNRQILTTPWMEKVERSRMPEPKKFVLWSSNKTIFKTIFLFVFLSVGTVKANESQEQKKIEPNPFYMFHSAEALFAVNAWMASEDPNAYGAIGALVFPIAGCNVKYCLDLAAFETVAIYNLSIDPDEMSKSEIFKNNIIAWHLAAGFTMLSAHIFEDKGYKLNFIPTFDGGGIQFKYNF
jgi:hypothetical protein